jgi:hypothetical protein
MRRGYTLLALFVILMGTMALSFVVVRAEPPPTTVLETIAQGKPLLRHTRGNLNPVPALPSAPDGIIVYLNRDVFTSAYPTIPFEDFGDTSTSKCVNLTAIPAPLNAFSTNSCFSPGDVLPGVEFRDNPMNGDGNGSEEGLVFVPPGDAGITNSSVTGNHFTNTFEILLTPTATVVGLDLVTLFGEDTLRIRLYGASDLLLYETILPAVGPSGFFMGFEVNRPIERIELLAADGSPSVGAEGVSGIFFGSPNAEITLDLTVGTDPTTCATTDDITIPPNTEVTYCYRVTNNTPITLSTHTLTDTVFGTILAQDEYEIAPGASFVLTASDTPLGDDSNTATWTALAPLQYTLLTGSCGVFPDITATGTPLNLEDDEYADVSLPIPFQFYDIITSKVLVSNNGLIIAQETDEDLPTVKNVPFPTDLMRRIIAPFWDDLDDETGNVYVGTYVFDGTVHGPNSMLAPAGIANGPTTYFAIEWYNRRHFDGPDGNGVTFTTLLAYPGQGLDGYLVTCYKDTELGDPLLDFGASATIGINQFDTNAYLYSYNTPHPELAESYGVGYSAVSSGNYIATDTASVNVFNPDISVAPLLLGETHNPAPQTTLLTLTLSNGGTDPLTWEMAESTNNCATPQSISWLASDTVNGILPRNTAVSIGITFDSGALPDGTYNASLCITSDDPDEELTVIPVTFTVQGSPVEPFTQLYLPIVRRR